MSGSVWYISVSKKKIEFKRYPKKPRKTTKKKNFMIGFLFLTALISLSGLISAAAINDTFHINLQTTYSNGSIQNGTFTFAFNITESSNTSCLSPVVYNHSTSLATDSRGIASLYLPTSGSGGGNLSTLDFDKQYYLCYYRDGSLKDVSQLGRVPYSFRATQVNLSEVSIDSNLSLGNFWALLNRTGINTTTPQNLLNVIGDGNFTSALYVNNKSLEVGYEYAINSTGSGDTFAANYSNFTTIYGYAINDSLWTLNYSTYLTKPTWAQVTNGTNVALVTAANTFGNFNQTFNGTTLFLWALNNRIGIGTTTPQNLLNVVGDANVTGLIYGNGSQLTNVNASTLDGYDSSYFMPLNTSVVGNFDFNGGWQNGGFSISGGNIFAQTGYFYNISSLQVTNLNVNGSMNSYLDNQFDLGNATNRWRNIVLGSNLTVDTNILFVDSNSDKVGIITTTPQNTLNVVGDANATGTMYAQRTKNLSIGYDYATNGSLISSEANWNANYSNFTTIYGYAINDSLWTLNYSDYLTKPTWAQVTNGTSVARVDAANSFGAFNQTFNTSNLVIWALLNRTGIQTISPQNTLNVIGDVNATTTVFSQNKNLSLGYDYALNASSTGITWATAYNGTLAKTDAANSFGVFNQTFNTSNLVIWALLNRTGIQTTSPQNTLNIVGDVNATTSVFAQNTKNLSIGYDYATNGSLLSGETNWNANYSNFTTVYGNALGWANNASNFTTVYGNQLGNASNMTTIYGYALNASLWTLNYSTYLTKPTWAQVVNGTAITMTTGAYALNDSLWTLNYTDYLAIRTYATNASLWTLNYSTYLTKPTWAQVVNGTAITMTTGAYALNDSLWTLNYSTYLTKPTWAQVTNGTMASWANAINGTLYLASNPNGYTDDQTASEILTAIKTVDGAGSGLDADLLDGISSASFASWANVVNGTMASWANAINGTLYLASNPSGYTDDQTASEILTAIKTVDGAGSGLDADLLDGISSASFASWANVVNGTMASWANAINGTLYLASNPSGYTDDQTASEILAALVTVDGAGSGLDADLLDGVSSASFSQLGSSIESSEITDLTIAAGDIANDVIGDTQLAFNTGQALTTTSSPTFNKITVTTIDPPYVINGVGYATYVSSIAGGVKEEVSGTVTLNSNYVIDFKKLEVGSDLWLFYQITDFGGNWEKLQVILTPGFNGNVWYEKNPKAKTLTIHGSQAGEVSYRMTANRHDWRKWTNYLSNNSTGTILMEK